MSVEDRAHLAEKAEEAEQRKRWRTSAFVLVSCDTLIHLAAHLARVEAALGAYADLENWGHAEDTDSSWMFNGFVWENADAHGSDLARAALGLPKAGEGGEA